MRRREEWERAELPVQVCSQAGELAAGWQAWATPATGWTPLQVLLEANRRRRAAREADDAA